MPLLIAIIAALIFAIGTAFLADVTPVSLERRGGPPSFELAEDGEGAGTTADEASTEVEAVHAPAEKIATPGPLTGPETAERSVLTRAGVVAWTNEQRVRNGMPPLRAVLQLHQSATAKLGDMFERQYFAHESPTGESVDILVERFSYAYLFVGENLALGNFKSDEALVQAWMDSPGHRANILNPAYTEIGVSVQQGVYKGRQTWIAVQHFAMPRSACPRVDAELDGRIERNKRGLAQLNALLSEKREAYESYPRGSEERREEIDEYNEVVRAYNDLLKETRDLVARYNAQIRAFNTCIGKLSYEGGKKRS